jgi:hypothetical protein
MNVRKFALIVILSCSEGSLDDCGNADPSEYLRMTAFGKNEA